MEDENCFRIRALVDTELKQLGRDGSGWDALFVDPGDNRLWELTYPESGDHGGGPPQLAYISDEDAKLKYPSAALER